jgi:hypothetical protein
MMRPKTTAHPEDGSQHPDCNEKCCTSRIELDGTRYFLPMRDSMGKTERDELVPAQTGSGEVAELEEERRKLRRLQIMMSMVMSVISQDADLSVEEASELAANAKRAALAMFPDKEFAYDILYKPRLQRLLAERYRLQ